MSNEGIARQYFRRFRTCTALLAFTLIIANLASNLSAADRITICVLEPQNLTGDTNADHWKSSTAGVLQRKLRAVAQIRICPESSLDFAFHELKLKQGQPLRPEDIRKIGGIADARWVIFGDYQQAGSNWILNTQLMNTTTGQTSKKLGETGPEKLKVLSKTAQNILLEMGVTPSKQEMDRIKKPNTVSEKAFELASRGIAAIFDSKSLTVVAESFFKQAVSLDPNFGAAHASLSHCYLLENRLDDAEDEAKLAVQTDDDLAYAHATLGEAYRQNGLIHAACNSLIEAQELDPDDESISGSLAWAYGYLGKTQEQRAALEEAERLAPYSSYIHSSLSLVYSYAGQREKALEEVIMAVRCNAADTDPSYEHYIAMAYNSLNDLPEAAKHYEKFLERTKDTGVEIPVFAQDKDRLKALHAMMTPHFVTVNQPKEYKPEELQKTLATLLTPSEYKSLPKPLQCTPEMESWAKQLVGDATDPQEKAKRLFDAFIKRAYRDFGPTRRTASEVFAGWPDPQQNFTCQENTLLYMALARTVGLKVYFAYVYKDPYTNVLDHACPAVFINDKALLVDPTYRWFGTPHQQFRLANDVELLGLYCCQLTNLALVELGPKLAPDSEYTYFNLAEMLAKNNRPADARKALEKGLKLDTNSWHSFFVRAVVEGDELQWDAAIVHLKQVLEINPHFNEAHYYRGTALVHQGLNLDEAKKEFHAFLQGETDPQALGDALSGLAWIDQKLQNQNTGQSNAPPVPADTARK